MRAYLAYPVRSRRAVDALLVGGGLHLLAEWLPLLPFVVVLGYLARVFAATAAAGRLSAAPTPRWRPLRPLVADGLRLSATAAAYLAVPLLVTVVTLGGPLERLDPAGTAEGGLVLVGSTVTLFTALVLLYPFPAALAAVARTRSLRAAVDRRLIGVATRDGGYLFAVLVGGAALGTVAAVYAALNAAAVGFFLAFYVEVAAAAAAGSAAGRAWTRAGVTPAEGTVVPGIEERSREEVEEPANGDGEEVEERGDGDGEGDRA